MKKILIGIAVLAVAGALYWALGGTPEEQTEISYVTVPVTKGSLKAEINATGTVKPLTEVLVGTQVSGTIRELHADFETQVTKGQLIALIDPDKYAAKENQAKADLLAAKAVLNKAEVTRDDELRTLRRKEGLIHGGSISQSDYDTAKTKADAAVAEVEVDQAKVAQADAKLDEARLEHQYCRIIAPVNGVVTARTGDVGQTVTASFQTPVLFKIAEDLTRMQVLTNVDEADIGRVRVGQKAEFTVPAFPDETFKASVSQIRNEPVVEQNVVTYIVVLDVHNEELKLRPGMTANVQVLLSEIPDALMVPDQAFRYTPAAGAPAQEKAGLPALTGREKRVWKLIKQNRLQPLTVQIGLVGNERVQIFSDQIAQGDKVVVEEVVKKKGPQMRAIRFRF